MSTYSIHAEMAGESVDLYHLPFLQALRIYNSWKNDGELEKVKLCRSVSEGSAKISAHKEKLLIARP